MPKRHDLDKLKLLQQHSAEIELWTNNPHLAQALKAVEKHGRQKFEINIGDIRIIGACELNPSSFET